MREYRTILYDVAKQYCNSHPERRDLGCFNHPLVLNNLVDEPVSEGLIRSHIEVPISVYSELLDWLLAEGGHVRVERILGVQH